MSFVGDAIGSVIGGITGSNNAAEAQKDAANQSAALSREQFEAIQKNLAPFLQFGTSQLQGLGGLMQPLNRQQELEQFYQSPEFAMQSRQARGQQLAAAEATGGLGSTSTGNALASIAPQLGMGYLGQREAQQADLFNRLMAGAGMGLNAAAQQGQAGQNYVSQASNSFSQYGAAQAGKSLAPFNTLMQVGGMALGGGLF
ncbi:MAG: DNA transfer protein [Synechococcaceae bacterium WB4_2_0811]|nr:DNA transfer protein [Synechococcaceae bacterium WB4_2_0811]